MVLRCKYGHGLEKLIPHRVQILGSITLLLPPPPSPQPSLPLLRMESGPLLLLLKWEGIVSINALVMGEEETLAGEAKQLPPPALAQGLDPLLRFIDLV